MGRGDYRNYYKGHMDKTKGAWNQGRDVGMVGVRRKRWEEKPEN